MPRALFIGRKKIIARERASYACNMNDNIRALRQIIQSGAVLKITLHLTQFRRQICLGQIAHKGGHLMVLWPEVRKPQRGQQNPWLR